MKPANSAKPIRIDSASSAKPLPAKKRVSRACDECRLHKARCDGAKSCETCFRYDRVCSYNLLPAECKGSAARIRILEHRLAKARECIGNLQKQLPESDPSDFDQTLAPQSQFEPSVLTTPSSVYKTSPHSSPAETVSAVGGSFSLVESLLRPLSSIHQVRSLTNSALARSIVCDAGPSIDHGTTSDSPPQLPPYDSMLDLIFAAFNNTFGLCNIVVEHEFRIVAQRLYDNNHDAYTLEDTEFVPLFCSVIALGMISSISSRHTHGYDQVLKQSFLYFENASASIAGDQECASLVKLQVTLCLVLYLLNTSKLDLARPALRTVCTSPMVRGLFARVSAQRLGSQSFLDLRIKDLVWTIHYLDMHVSGLLGLSCLLSTPGPELATVHAINTAAHNIANHRRTDNNFLASVSVAMGIELLKLIGRITSATTVVNTRYGLPSPCSDIPEWNDLRVEFDTWEFMLKSIFAENDGNLMLIMARHHLQCHLFLAQITLYHAFLRQHCESKPMRHPSDVDDISKGQACTAAATNAISYISMYLEQSRATSLPFHSAYILFISLLTLMVASAFTDDHGRHGLQHAMHIATHVLTNSNFGNDRTKTVYLDFIQVLSSGLENQSQMDSDRHAAASAAFSTSRSPTSMTIYPSNLDLYSPPGESFTDANKRHVSHASSPEDRKPGIWDFDPC